MAWIETEGSEEVSRILGELRALLPGVYTDPESSQNLPEPVASESIVRSHALLPQVMEPIFLAQARLMQSELPLSRREHELIASTVSALNDCFY
jgi:hypothetical protein